MISKCIRVSALLGSIFLSTSSWAIKVPVTQYANVSPLPGGCIALNQDGKPDGRGAMQINIPVAYTPGNGYASLGAFSGEHLNAYYSDKEQNGTGVLAFGFGGWPKLYASAMAVSSWIADDSKSVSFQLQCIKETDKVPAVAVGVQDLLNKEWKQFRQKMNTKVGYYAVATKQFDIDNKSIYTTLGYGAGKFLNRPFVGLSYPINDHLSIASEYDGYQINGALGWRPLGRYSSWTVAAGFNGKCGPFFGGCATGTMNSAWSVPIGLYLIYK
ncbi:MAG: YjbH domain-containing protein [Armatimonadota bacterium]